MNKLLRILAFMGAIVSVLVAGLVLFFGILNSGELPTIPSLVLAASVGLAVTLGKFAITRTDEKAIKIPRNASEATNEAMKSVDSVDLNVRQMALNSLSASTDPYALYALVELAGKHTAPDIFIGAALILARKKTDNKDIIVRGLVSALTHEYTKEKIDKRKLAVYFLGEIGNPECVEQLTSALKTVFCEYNQRGVVIEIVKTLGKLRNFHAVPTLIDLFDLSCNGSLHRDTQKEIASALGEIGDVRAVPKLIPALQESYWGLDAAVASALEKIGTPEALAAVEGWRRRQQNPQ